MSGRSYAPDLSIAFLTGADKSQLLEMLIQNGQKIRAVILPNSSRREERLASVSAVAHRHSVPVFRPKRTEFAPQLRELAPDVLFSVGYPYLLTSEDLHIARYNLNLHPTLLPRYRGPATAWHIIAHGEKESGVTVHFIDEGMDTGPILVQRRVTLTRFDTVRSLMRKTSELEGEAALDALEKLRSDTAQPVHQDENQATIFTELRTPEDSRIDPSRSVSDLYDFIRACDADRFPAFFEVDGQRVGMSLFRLERPADEEDLI